MQVKENILEHLGTATEIGTAWFTLTASRRQEKARGRMLFRINAL